MAASPPRVRQRTAVVVTLLAAGLACLAMACGPGGDTSRAALPPPPTVDVAPLAPGVRAQLSTLLAEVRATPTDAAANLNAARALLAYELFDAGTVYLTRAASLTPGDFTPPYLLGWAHAVVGHRDAALEAFDRALVITPGHPQALLRRAEVLRRMDRPAEAEAAFREILLRYPDQPNARFGLGNVLVAQGKFAEAIDLLRPLVAEYDQFGAAHYALALAYRSQGDTEQASRQFAEYQINRTWEPQFDDAVVDALKEMNRSHQGLYLRSLKAAAADDWAQAAALLEEATSQDPNFLVGHVNLITCYAHLGDATRAQRHYEAALALSPDSAELQNTQGLVAKVAGRMAEARAHFQKALAADPSHYSSLENLGLLDFEAGRLEDALAQYRRAAAIAPASSRSWIMIGTIRLKQRRPEEARDAFLHVVRPGPEADAAVLSVRQAYDAASDVAAMREWAHLALEQARRSGMTGVQSRLERWIA